MPRVLAIPSDEHRPSFAAAIYTGLRKGGLAGLRKTDIDFGAGVLSVCRSYGRDTTKGKRAAAVPVATELVPYLETAIRRSKSPLVFAGHDGEMMSDNAPLEEVLRRALGRAGIVEHDLHVCRKKGCTYQQRDADDGERRCSKHGYRLWPNAIVRKIRFHDLRHTTASLLMMSGANPAPVQRNLRHSDPTQVYISHLLQFLRLQPELRAAIAALPPGAPQRLISERRLRQIVRLPHDRQLTELEWLLRWQRRA